jgi:hypothetical protein
MRISFDARERAILVARLGLPPGVSNEQIEDAVIGKVFAVKPTPPRPTPPPAPRPAPSGPRHLVPVRSQDAEEAIAAAISEDRIMPARANHYRARCQRDPSGTADLLARLVSVPGLNARTSWTPFPDLPNGAPEHTPCRSCLGATRRRGEEADRDDLDRDPVVAHFHPIAPAPTLPMA